MCGDNIDLVDGYPTGSVRISFGYMSTLKDAQKFMKFIEQCFVDKTSQPKAHNTGLAVEAEVGSKVDQGIDTAADRDANSYSGGILVTNQIEHISESADPTDSREVDTVSSRESGAAVPLLNSIFTKGVVAWDTPHCSTGGGDVSFGRKLGGRFPVRGSHGYLEKGDVIQSEF